MSHIYTDTRSVHVPTKILELLDEARVAAQVGNALQSQAFLSIAEFYVNNSAPNSEGLLYYKEQTEVDSDN